MDKGTYNQNIWDILYLSACALNRIQANIEKVSEMDLHAIYRIAKYHTMTSIVYMALDGSGIFDETDTDLVKEWSDAWNKAIRKNILLDMECQKMIQFMEKKGIWHMLLKGSVLKNLYPAAEMRQMADIDILFDADYQMQMHQYMINHGYKAEAFGVGVHDTYVKPPVYNFELHTALFGGKHDAWIRYYSDVKNRILQNEGSSFGYHFRDEDFYIYIMTHAYKHYISNGTGLRSLLDIYVYINKKGKELDWNYINEEAEKLGIRKFEKQCRKLSLKLFSNPRSFSKKEFSEEERRQLFYFVYSGTYGNQQNNVKNKLKIIQPDRMPISRKTKWKYYIQRLFPNMEWYKTNAPFCHQHKWAIPFFWIYRLLYSVLFKRKNIMQEIKIVKNSEKI